MHGDPSQLVGNIGGSFGGQNPYASSGLGGGGGSGLGSPAALGSPGGASGVGLGDNSLAAGSLGSATFNMSGLQSALPAVQTGGSASDSFTGATGGGGGSAYNSAVPTPHETPHNPYGTPHAVRALLVNMCITCLLAALPSSTPEPCSVQHGAKAGIRCRLAPHSVPKC